MANSVGRGDALMAVFVLLGVLAYLHRFRSEWIRVGLVGLAYALALAAKENGVALPVLLVVLPLLFPGRSTGRSEREGPSGSPSVSTQLPLFATLAGVLLLYLGLRYQVLGTLFHRDAAPYIMTLPTSLRLQLDFVRGLLLAGRSEEALAIVPDLPPADPTCDVYLTQSHIQLGQPDLAFEAVQGGLSRFPEDARLMRQARRARCEPVTNP